MSRLAVDNLVLSRGHRTILHGVSFRVEQPCLIGLLGPNGAGKSTLLRGLAGLTPADSGQIHLGDALLTDIPAHERARKLALLPQERTVHWPLHVHDVVMLGRMPYRSLLGRPSETDRQAVAQAMRDMHVDQFATRPFSQLSGGEQARVLIARTLAQDPDLLLADEPVNGLDPAHQISLMTTLQTIVAAGRTIIVSLHDLTLAARFCDRLLLLHEGRLVGDGTAETVLSADNLAHVYGISAHHLDIDGQKLVIPMQV